MEVGFRNFASSVFSMGNIVSHVDFLATKITFSCHNGWYYNLLRENCELVGGSSFAVHRMPREVVTFVFVTHFG